MTDNKYMYLQNTVYKTTKKDRMNKYIKIHFFLTHIIILAQYNMHWVTHRIRQNRQN